MSGWGWATLVLALIAAGSFGWGVHVEDAARSADEAIGSVIPYSLGCLFLLATIITAIVWAAKVWR